MTILQKPDGMSDEDWEDYLEEYAEKHSTDIWDTVEEMRKFLNSSKIEAMHMIKKSSRFGNQCPYYLKAKHLFDRDERAQFLTLLDKINQELNLDD